MQPLIILAATSGQPGIWNTFLAGFPHLTGMLVVLLTLAVLWGVCELTAWLIKRFAPEPAAAPAESAPPVDLEFRAPQPAATPEGAIPPQIVAAIAAAVHTAVGKGHKVVAIKHHDSNWEKAGRQAVLGSHRIR